MGRKSQPEAGAGTGAIYQRSPIANEAILHLNVCDSIDIDRSTDKREHLAGSEEATVN
jgi:hypothetical protein